MRGLLLLLLGSCVAGPGTPTLDLEERAGSRLGLLRQENDAGVGITAAFWDHHLDLPCRMALAADDTERCLPVSLGRASEQLEPACFDLWVSTPSCEDAPYILLPMSERSDSPYKVYEAIPSPRTCSAYGEAQTYTLGEEVPPARFAPGRTVDLLADSNIGARVSETDDGARRVAGLLADGQACEPAWFEDDRLRCTPPHATLRGFFSDPGCTDQAATSSVFLPADAWVFEGLFSYDLRAWRAGGEAVRVDRLYAREDGTCRTVELTTGVWVLPRGEPVDAAELPELTLSWIPGSLPTLQSVTGPSGVRHHPRGVWSATGDGEGACYPIHFADGQVRCVGPELLGDFSPVDAYRDEACTDRVTRVLENSHPRVVLDRPAVGTCQRLDALGEVTAVFAVGETVPASDARYARVDGVCEPLDPLEETLGLEWVRTVPVDPSLAGPALQVLVR